jgi:hypothetical protein
MVAEECQADIEGILGGPELTTHEIPNLKIMARLTATFMVAPSPIHGHGMLVE